MVLGVYLLFNSMTAPHPGESAIIVSPTIPLKDVERCLVFDLCVFGQHIGYFTVRDQVNTILFAHIGQPDISTSAREAASF